MLSHLSTEQINYLVSQKIEPKQFLPFIEIKDFELNNTLWYDVAYQTPVSYTHLDVYKRQDLDTPLIKELCDSFAEHQQLASSIDRCISLNAEVLDSASPALKSIRKSILSCNADISSEVQRFLSRNASKLMDTITTMRNNRTCVLVKISEKNSVDGFVHGEKMCIRDRFTGDRSCHVWSSSSV